MRSSTAEFVMKIRAVLENSSCGLACALLGLATLGVASVPCVAQQGERLQPDAREGSYASTHIVVELTPRFARAAETAHLTRGGQFVTAARSAMSRELDASFRRWGAFDIRPIFNFDFIHADLAAKHGLDRFFVLEAAPGADMPAMAADFARHTDEIAAASVDAVGGVTSVFPDDPDFDRQWGLHNDGTELGCTEDADIDAPEAWEIETGEIAEPVIVAVVDSGVDPHPEFAARMVPGINTADPDPNGTGDDCTILHGTHVAGIIAAGGNDELGMAGICWGCRIMPVDILLDTQGGCSGFVSDLSEGISWAADHGAGVINMSLQYCGLTALQQVLLQNSLNFAADLGAVLIAATGNNYYCGVGQIAWPGRMSSTLAVGGITCDGTRAEVGVSANWSSNYGPEIDIVAPGDHIYSCAFGDTYQYLDGTSMATPHASGVAALIKSYVPSMPNTAILQLIKDTAVDIDAPGWDERTGRGRLNAYQALLAAPDYPRIVQSDPPSGAIDARRPHNPHDAQFRYGWNTVDITFPAAVGVITAADFVVTQTGGQSPTPPSISSVSFIDPQHRRIVLNRPIDPKAWTSIVHKTSQSRVLLGYLSGDVNGNACANAEDILALIDALNGVGDPLEIWSGDVDRSGVSNPADILEVIDLLNGAGIYEAYNNVCLPRVGP